jgi:hypothetical protein
MADTYACWLPLGDPPRETFDRAVRLAADWILEHAVVEAADAADVTAGSGDFAPREGHRVLWQLLADPLDRHRLWTITWHRPLAEEEGVGWRLRAQVGLEDTGSWASVRIALQPTTYRLRPPVGFDLFRPGLVPALLDGLEVTLDGRRLPTTPTTIARAGVADLVALLERPDRVLPVVVVSPVPETRRPLIDVSRTANVLAGLAHVMVIDDPQTTYALTNTVGKHHSVFEGAVRMYWPGWERAGDPFAHPLWLAGALRADGLHSRLPNELLRIVAAVAAMRVPEPSPPAAAEDG